MWVVMAEPGTSKWVVRHPRLGAYPLLYPSEEMAKTMAWVLNSSPYSIDQQS